jgi:hypothetical protein
MNHSEAIEHYEKLPEVMAELNGVSIPGMTATLVERTDKKAMYKRWDDVYEVFRIKIVNEKTVFGKTYPRHEVYPGNEDFGSTAWCFKNEQLARRRYKVL